MKKFFLLGLIACLVFRQEVITYGSQADTQQPKVIQTLNYDRKQMTIYKREGTYVLQIKPVENDKAEPIEVVISDNENILEDGFLIAKIAPNRFFFKTNEYWRDGDLIDIDLSADRVVRWRMPSSLITWSGDFFTFNGGLYFSDYKKCRKDTVYEYNGNDWLETLNPAACDAWTMDTSIPFVEFNAGQKHNLPVYFTKYHVFEDGDATAILYKDGRLYFKEKVYQFPHDIYAKVFLEEVDIRYYFFDKVNGHYFFGVHYELADHNRSFADIKMYGLYAKTNQVSVFDASKIGGYCSYFEVIGSDFVYFSTKELDLSAVYHYNFETNTWDKNENSPYKHHFQKKEIKLGCARYKMHNLTPMKNVY